MRSESLKNFSKTFWLLFKDYWCSEEKWRARGLLTAVIVLNIIIVFLLLALASWYNEFYTILQDYSYQQFWQSIGKFTALAMLLIASSVYAYYLQQMLQIKWRTWMTERYLGKWLYRQNYYKMQMGSDTDNPDQRIQEDLNLFADLTLTLGVEFFKQFITLISFLAMLWELSGNFAISLGGSEVSIPGFMVWMTLIYSVFGTFITHKIGRRLIGLNFNQQKYEADFRFSLVRLRENSECVAFYQGEAPEANNFRNRFKNVITNFRAIMNRQKILRGVTVSYAQIAIILPVLIAAPRYFGEQLSIGWLMQTLTAFGKVQDALSYFVSSYTDIAKWASVIRRLNTFAQHMRAADKIESPVIINTGNSLITDKLTVALPQGDKILCDLDMQLDTGESLIITGASGCGKSTLLRTFAGIWPFASGKMTLPCRDDMMFLPQRPYLPLGTLHQALYYPQTEPEKETADLPELLRLCGLDKFIEQLDEVNEWSRILSLGEQQRLAFARILLKKPAWVFLDEATSALDEKAEDAMYRLLKNKLPKTAVISVGHRAALLKYHKFRFDFGKSEQISQLSGGSF